MSEAQPLLRPSAPDLQTLRRGHARRLAGLDPMLPEPPSLLARPEASRLLAVDQDDSAAAGLWRVRTIGPTDYVASFSWLRRHTLHVFLDGPDRQTATSLLLDRWCKDVGAEPPAGALTAPDDIGAAIRWPARDVAGVAALVRHGFFPESVVSVRSTGLRRSVRPARRVEGVTLRPAQLRDIDSVCALHLEALFFDDRLGGMHLRASTERAVRGRQVAALSRNDATVLLAERDGNPIGLAALTLPAADSWAAPLVRAGQAAAVSTLSVTEGERSRGIGQLLAEAVHARAAEAGADVTLVHYASVNPYSTRFWNAQGYRPLWLNWSAPLSRLIANL